MTFTVECADLRASYLVDGRQEEVLRGLSFALETGSFACIEGPSGCGKTTLLFCLAGLQNYDSGWLRVCGRDFNALTMPQRATLRAESLGIIFQNYNLVPSLNVMENMCLPFYAQGKRVDQGQIHQVMERLQIRELATKFPWQLSGGQQQRVAIARVLASRPQLVIADEPTGALNSEMGLEVVRMLSEYIREVPGASVLMVTHNPALAAFADTRFFMKDGLLWRGE